MLRPLLALGLFVLLATTIALLLVHEPPGDAQASLGGRSGEVATTAGEGADLGPSLEGDAPPRLAEVASEGSTGRVTVSALSEALVVRLAPPASTGKSEREALRGAVLHLQRWEQPDPGSARWVENETFRDWSAALESRWPGAGATLGVRFRGNELSVEGVDRRLDEEVGDVLLPVVVRGVEVATEEGRKVATVRLGTPYVAVGTVEVEGGGAPPELSATSDPWDPKVQVDVERTRAVARRIDGGDRSVDSIIEAALRAEPAEPAVFRVRRDRWEATSIVLAAPGYETARLALPEAQDGDPVQDLGRVRLTRAPRIVGRVVDEAGEPIEGLRISAGQGWPFVAVAFDEATCDGEGRFELAPPSDAEVVVSGRVGVAGRVLGVGPVNVGRSRGALDLIARELPRLRIEVTGPDGEPLAGRVMVHLRYLGGAANGAPSSVRKHASRATDGELVLPGLERGRWHVQLFSDEDAGEGVVEAGDGEASLAIQLVEPGR